MKQRKSWGLLLASVFASTGWGQGVVDVQDQVAILPAAAPAAAELPIERLREALHRYLAVRIDELDRVCELSDKQRQKLQVAAKGVVQRTLDQQRNHVRPAQLQAGVRRLLRNVEVVVDALAAPLAEALPGEPARPRAPQPGAAAAAPVMAREAAAISLAGFQWDLITQQRLWTNALNKVLTVEQRAAYDKSVTQRAQFELDVARNQLISRIDAELLLAPRQREQLARVVDEQLVERLGLRKGRNRASFLHNLPLANVVQIIPRGSVEPILSDAQLARWSDLADNNFAPAARGRWRVAPPRVVPAVPLQPAEPVPAPR